MHSTNTAAAMLFVFAIIKLTSDRHDPPFCVESWHVTFDPVLLPPMQHIVEHLQVEMQPLADQLWPNLDDAYGEAYEIARSKSLLGPSHRFIVAELSRTLLHHSLQSLDLGPWEVRPTVARAGIHLAHRDFGHQARVYRAMPDGAPPPAGAGQTRRSFYRQNGQEQLVLNFDANSTFPDMNLLLVWGVRAEGIWIDVIRTTGAWPHGGKAKYDLRFPMPMAHSDDEEFIWFEAQEDAVFPEIEVINNEDVIGDD